MKTRTGYCVDIDAVMEWVSRTPSSEKNVDTTITQEWENSEEDKEAKLFHKEISETKSTMNAAMSNIRYDLIRNLLTALFAPDVNISMGTARSDSLSVQQSIAFNSLLKENLITFMEGTADEDDEIGEEKADESRLL